MRDGCLRYLTIEQVLSFVGKQVSVDQGESITLLINSH